METKKLNLGCGQAKITGAVNVDFSEKVEPDVVANVAAQLPFGDEEFDEVYFFHCIEHIEKWKHRYVLTQIHRVLKLGGTLYLSYPEFEEIIQRWMDNRDNKRPFWEATIFGRQLYPGDYHFSAINTLELKELLFNVGFKLKNEFAEPVDNFNTVLVLERIEATPSYEEVLYKEIFAR